MIKEVSGIVFVDSSPSNMFDGFDRENFGYIAKLAMAEHNLDIIESTNQVKEITKKDLVGNTSIIF